LSQSYKVELLAFRWYLKPQDRMSSQGMCALKENRRAKSRILAHPTLKSWKKNQEKKKQSTTSEMGSREIKKA
jgi:hypothetical protein